MFVFCFLFVFCLFFVCLDMFLIVMLLSIILFFLYGEITDGSIDGLTCYRFFAVSEDKCVGLYTMDSMRCRHLFGVHTALVSSLKAKREQDYLLVECVDGSVAVWEMGTGDLDGVVYGQVAREISETSDTVSNMIRPTNLSHPSF